MERRVPRPNGRSLAGACWGVLICCGFSSSALGQAVTIPLWPAGPPGMKDDAPGPRPSLTLYQPAPSKATGAAIVVCPGGGYQGLADHEGRPIAEWLNGLGITAVVLRYRLGPANHHPAMLDDAARAIRQTRANAREWRVDPARVGIIGFSAGGHLAATVGTHFSPGDPTAPDPVDRLSSRPDRLLLVYPGVSMREGITHLGSRRNLLGTDPPPDLVASLSNETQVRADTPPTFLVHTADDDIVSAENSLLFALALQRARVPVELHQFEKGPHGFGLGESGRPYAEWTALAAKWLDGQGFLKVGP